MLTAIKDRAQGLVAWIIVLLITVPFALWGINAYFENQGAIEVAEVDGESISYDVYRNRYDLERRQMQQYLGARFAPDMVDSLDFKRGVVERMVAEQLVTQATIDQGYRISDAQLNEFIRSRKEFQEDGKFSAERYERIRNASGRRDNGGYEAEMRRINMLQQVLNGFTQTAFVTGADRDKLLALMLQTRKFEYAVITPDRFVPKVEVSPQDVDAYYKANAARYQQPDQVRVAYLRLSLDDVARDFPASEQEIRAAYDENIERYRVEQRHARHILLPLAPDAPEADARKVAEQAGDLSAQAQSGADFAQLAREFSQDAGSKDKGGDLGFVARGATDPAFERVLFGLAPGATSAPVRTAFGYHVIQLVEVRKVLDKDFDSVRKDIEREVRRRKAAERFHELSLRFADLVYEQSESLDAAASELGLKVQESGWFSRQGGEGPMRDPKVINAAFSEEVLSENLNSPALELEGDMLVSLRKLEFRAAVTRPLDAVRADVEKAIRHDKAVARAGSEGAAILAQLRGGAEFGATMAGAELAVQSPGAMRRDGKADVNPRVIAAAFSATRPAAGAATYTGLSLGDGGYALVRLVEVIDGDPKAADDRMRAQADAVVRDRRGAQYFEAMQNGLRKSAKVTIHADKL